MFCLGPLKPHILYTGFELHTSEGTGVAGCVRGGFMRTTWLLTLVVPNGDLVLEVVKWLAFNS